MPRQRKFYEDLTVINGCLDDLISRAKDTRQAKDIEALQSRDYSKVRAPRHMTMPHRTLSQASERFTQALCTKHVHGVAPDQPQGLWSLESLYESRKVCRRFAHVLCWGFPDAT